jgi:glycosyltransferase involved in cell wall biosynthesis
VSAPRVTVLMPVYNAEAFVAQSAASILNQTFGDFELLVVDDGSTDATSEILRSYDDRRLRIIRNPENLGLTRSLNIGLSEARGALVARQDADDISYPERLECQVAFLDAHPDVPALGAQFHSIDGRGRRRPLHLWMKCETSLGIRWQLIFENALIHSSVMFRRDVVADLFHGYDETFQRNQDFDLWTRIARRYPLRNLHETLISLRGRPDSLNAGYTRRSIARVREVCVAYADDTLGAGGIGQEGLDALLQGMSPRICPPLRNLQPVIQWIDDAYRRFIVRWPEAAQLREIRAHAASLVARLAILSAVESPGVMSRWYLQAARYNVPMFARGLVRFAATGGRALFRHNP